MTIAELFVKLGVKGTDETKKKLKEASNGLKEVKDMSIEAKAAILGAVYGLEQMMKKSVERGTGLVQFAAATGISIEKLGTLENVFRQFGVSGGEVEGVLKNVQMRMAEISAGKGVSGEFMLFAQKTQVDMKRLNDIPYMLQKFQQFAPTVKPEYLRMLMSSLGFSDNIVQAMIRNARSKKPINFETVGGGNIYSTREAGALDKANIAWDNLHDKVNKAFGRFFAGHGMKIVSDLSKITDQVVILSEALIKLADKIQLFERFSNALTGISNILSIVGGIADKMQGGTGEMTLTDEAGKKKKFNMFEGVTAPQIFKDWQAMIRQKGVGPLSLENPTFNPRNGNFYARPSGVPDLGAMLSKAAQNNETNITIHAQTDKPKEIADHTQRAIERAHKVRVSNTRAN